MYTAFGESDYQFITNRTTGGWGEGTLHPDMLLYLENYMGKPQNRLEYRVEDKEYENVFPL